ncbi:MAG: LPS-assembly protein LptD [Candidatus Omnitrophica bacterium]|nr:LPS-assembly protein LptD [Candidatus Omnitrophota bacterium]
MKKKLIIFSAVLGLVLGPGILFAQEEKVGAVRSALDAQEQAKAESVKETLDKQESAAQALDATAEIAAATTETLQETPQGTPLETVQETAQEARQEVSVPSQEQAAETEPVHREAGQAIEFIKKESMAEEEKGPQPIVVNGDKVEYSADTKDVTAIGNVEVVYKGAKLTCQKLTVNTLTRQGVAEGNARLDDERGVIEGQKIVYNFETKSGIMMNAKFMANPYFGRAKKLEKVGDTAYVGYRTFITTCSMDHPHYKLGTKNFKMIPGEKIETRDDAFYVGDIPLAYIPRFNRSLKDPLMHVRVVPGKTKDWGPYVLSAWRYNLNDYMDGRIYLDFRKKLGWAEGFGLNYRTPGFGKGDFKFYFTREKPENIPPESRQTYTRELVRWRHKWDIDERTDFISEFYKIKDDRRKFQDPQRNILKDYFFREYEKDSEPLTYALLHHNFQYSTLDFLIQKRTNPWYDQLSKLPELKYILPRIQIGETPLYFENNTTFGNYDKNATLTPVTPDEEDVTRFDTTNKFSLPMKVSFFRVTPFVASRETFYDKGSQGKAHPMRSIFYTGADISTKFYRVFDVKSNFLGMNIEGLRHIITPLVSYNYNHKPSVSSSQLKQIDSVDGLRRNNSVSLELSNKLQTKRNGRSVDLLDFRVDTSYIIKPKGTEKSGSNFSDFLFNLKLLPYSWLRIQGDATYTHSGSRSNTNYNKFTDANYDINFHFGEERSIGIGQRYERKGGNEITANMVWRLNPKWKFSFYQRHNRGHEPTLTRGLREQEYTITRDLHCWEASLSWNRKKTEGDTIWVIFRLKAFPEGEFGFNQSYNEPKSGSQNNP